MKSIMDDCRKVDVGSWEIFEGDRRIGYFESDGKSYEFKSCAGTTIGGNGEIYGNQPVKWYLEHCAKTLKMNYWRYVKRKQEIKTWIK